MDGREVPAGASWIFPARVVVEIEPNLRTKILKTISDPNIAYVLFMIGLAGLYFELSQSRRHFSGCDRRHRPDPGLFLLSDPAGQHRRHLVDRCWLGFFILEIKVTSFGMLSVAGISVCCWAPDAVQGRRAQFQVAWQVLIPTVAFPRIFIGGDRSGDPGACPPAQNRRRRPDRRRSALSNQVDGLHGQGPGPWRGMAGGFEKPVSVGNAGGSVGRG
jgi:hypothetical protein